MRELYFNDTIDDAEYNGKLYGLGQTFTVTNGIGESVRGSAATIAEREDRSTIRELQSQATGSAQVHVAMGMASLATPAMAGALPAPLPTSPYGPISGPYMRSTMVGGGR
jgi:CCR4-NOT transcription complex subunit 7/8